MIDKKAAEALKKVPLSNNTVSRWINDVSVNIVGRLYIVNIVGSGEQNKTSRSVRFAAG